MKKLLLLIPVIIPFFCFSQNSKIGSSKFLDEKNGFKTIVLGADISTLNGQVSLSQDTAQFVDGVDFYLVDNKDILSVGDNIKLNKVVVGCFKQKIAYITLFFDKEYSKNLVRVYLESFGKKYWKPNDYIESYNWESKNVMLNINLEGLIENVSTYINKPLQKEIKTYQKEHAKLTAAKL